MALRFNVSQQPLGIRVRTEEKTLPGEGQVQLSFPLQPSRLTGGSEGSDNLARGHARHPPWAVSKGRMATALGGARVSVPTQPLVRHMWLEISPLQKQSRKQLCHAPPHHRPTLWVGGQGTCL